MRWAGHIACMELIKKYKFLFGKLETKRLGRPKRRWLSRQYGAFMSLLIRIDGEFYKRKTRSRSQIVRKCNIIIPLPQTFAPQRKEIIVIIKGLLLCCFCTAKHFFYFPTSSVA